MNKKETDSKNKTNSIKTTGGLYKNIKLPIKTIDTIIAIMGSVLLLIIIFLTINSA